VIVVLSYKLSSTIEYQRQATVTDGYVSVRIRLQCAGTKDAARSRSAAGLLGRVCAWRRLAV